MKIEIEIPDELVSFYQAEADARGVALERLLVAKMVGTNHIVKKDWDVAPPEEAAPTPEPKRGSLFD